MKINIKNYPAEAMKYLLDTCENWEYANWGLLGELGEVASLIAKAKRKGVDVDKAKLMLEIGDCFWFIALYAHLSNHTERFEERVGFFNNKDIVIGEWTNGFRVDVPNENSDMYYVYTTTVAELFSLLKQYDIAIEDCLQANIDKLADRKERGVIIGDGDHR